MKEDLLQEIKKMTSIADVGLLYSKDEYNMERYGELKQIALRLLTHVASHAVDDLQTVFPVVKDYPTVKVDVRGLVLNDEQKILLVRESADSKWSLPGGWADVGYSAKEVIVKEFKEEAGLDVIPERLLAVFDKKFYPHPPEPCYVYKMVIYCIATSYTINKGFDVLDVQYFSIDKLPELSTNRILQSQLELVYKKIIEGDNETYFD